MCSLQGMINEMAKKTIVANFALGAALGVACLSCYMTKGPKSLKEIALAHLLMNLSRSRRSKHWRKIQSSE